MVRGRRTQENADRRSKRRFLIDEELRSKLLYGDRITECGVGNSLNISSAGIWFTTENVLDTGTPVELSMNWPARLADVCPMKLMMYGCVVRSDPNGTAVSIERYEFRTRGSTPLPLYEETAIRLPA